MFIALRRLNLLRIRCCKRFSTEHALQSTFLRIMHDRGYLHQCTGIDRLDEYLSQQPCVAYLGFDATATSLHVGSLVQIMILRHFQQCGHKPIILIGGGTTMVGDPSGKSEERPIITRETIAQNATCIKSVFSKYLQFGEGPSDAVIVNNADWLCDINYMDFLSSYGRHFSINRMLTFDSVKQRLEREQPLSFLEFNYMLLQAYDFLHLHRTSACRLQFGGADQWGNIVSGVDLVRRVCRSEVFGLTTPLLTTSDGRKMGKSAAGAIWLDKELLSPYDFWQYWRNTSDADVARFMKLFTDIPLQEIEVLASNTSGEQWNKAKEKLADATTAMLHGAECLPDIHAQARAIFAQHSISDVPIDSLDQHSIYLNDNREDRALSDLLVSCSLCESKNKARTYIRSGAVRVDGIVIKNEYEKMSCEVGVMMKLSLGKKKHIAVNFKI